LIPKNDGDRWRLAKPNPPSSRKAMIAVDFGVYLALYEPFSLKNEPNIYLVYVPPKN